MIIEKVEVLTRSNEIGEPEKYFKYIVISADGRESRIESKTSLDVEVLKELVSSGV